MANIIDNKVIIFEIIKKNIIKYNIFNKNRV